MCFHQLYLYQLLSRRTTFCNNNNSLGAHHVAQQAAHCGVCRARKDSPDLIGGL